MEDALLNNHINIAEFLAPLSEMDEDKTYSTIHEE